jgi:hypothetical protein
MAGSLAKQVRLFGRTQGLIPDQTIGNRKTGTTHIPIAEHCPHHVPEQVICPPCYKQYFLAGQHNSHQVRSESARYNYVCVIWSDRKKQALRTNTQSPHGRRCQPGCAQSDRKHDQQRDQDLKTDTHTHTQNKSGTVMTCIFHDMAASAAINLPGS